MTETGQLANALHSLAIHLLRRVREEDVVSGLSPARLSVLSVLVYGSARTVSELAAAEQVTVPTMTRLLQALDASGHVRRERDRADQRVVRLAVTARGRRALEAARTARLARLEEVLAHVPADQRRAVNEAVVTLTAALQAAAARPHAE
jgi:DNA-binding MarR family transcriptional regulator